MHLIVVLLGLTGVLGKLIETGSTVLVWYRMLIAFLFLGVYIFLDHTHQEFQKSILCK